jgi:hypothetical protein
VLLVPEPEILFLGDVDPPTPKWGILALVIKALTSNWCHTRVPNLPTPSISNAGLAHVHGGLRWAWGAAGEANTSLPPPKATQGQALP